MPGRRSPHSDSVTPSVLPFVEQAAGQDFVGAGQSVEVLVEERQPAGVLGHQREAGAVDDFLDAQPRGEALGELRLTGAERANEGNSVAGLRDQREGGGEGAGFLFGAGRYRRGGRARAGP